MKNSSYPEEFRGQRLHWNEIIQNQHLEDLLSKI